MAIKNVLRMQGGHKPFSFAAISFSPKHYLCALDFVWSLLLCIWKTDGFACLYGCVSLNLVTCVFYLIVPWTPLVSHPLKLQPSLFQILRPLPSFQVYCPYLLSNPLPHSTFSVPAPHQTQAPSFRTSTEMTLIKPIPSLLSLHFPSPPTAQATSQAPTLPIATPLMKKSLCSGTLRFGNPKRSKKLK